MAVSFLSLMSVAGDEQQRDEVLVAAAAIMGREGMGAATLARVAKKPPPAQSWSGNPLAGLNTSSSDGPS